MSDWEDMVRKELARFHTGSIVQQGISGSGISRNTYSKGIVIAKTARKLKIIHMESNTNDFRFFKQPKYFYPFLCRVIGHVRDDERWQAFLAQLEASDYTVMVPRREVAAMIEFTK